MRQPATLSRLCSIILLPLLLLGPGTAQASVALGPDPGSSVAAPTGGSSTATPMAARGPWPGGAAAGAAGGILGLVFAALQGPRLEADGGPAFRLTWGATTTNAGVPATLTVQALNPDGSPNTAYQGTVQLTSSDPAASFSPAAPYTFQPADGGSRTFSVQFATAAAAQTVTVQDLQQGAAQVTSDPVAVRETVLVASASPSNPMLGSRVTFVVTAQDGQGNAVTGYQGTVALTSTWEGQPANAAMDWDPQAMQYGSNLYTFAAGDQGSHTFTPVITQDALVRLIATDAAQPSRSVQTGNLQVQDPPRIQGYGHGASPMGLKLQDGTTLVAWLGGRGQLNTRRISGSAADGVWGPLVIAHQELNSSGTIQALTYGADSPSLVQLGGTVALFHVFAGQDGQYWQLWVTTSTDGGKSWQSPRQLTTDSSNVERVQAVVKDGQAYVFWSRSGGDGLVHSMQTTDFATYTAPQTVGQQIGADVGATTASFGIAPAPGGGWAMEWLDPVPWQNWPGNDYNYPSVWFATSPDLQTWSAASVISSDVIWHGNNQGLSIGQMAEGRDVVAWSHAIWPWSQDDFARTLDASGLGGEYTLNLDPWAPVDGWANLHHFQPSLIGGTTWAMGAMNGAGYGDDPFGSPDVGIPGGMVDLTTGAAIGLRYPSAPVVDASFCPTGTCGQAGKPVDLATGMESASAVDMRFGVRGGTATLARAYTSAAGRGSRDGAFGIGWQWRWGVKVRAQPDGTASVVESDGRQTVYWRNPDGSYAPGTYSLDTLSASGGGWRLVRHDQTVLQFDGQGCLVGEADRRGNQTSLSYAGSGGTPSQVTFPGGRALSITSDGNGHVTQVQGPGGLATSYAYDGAGQLVAATDAAGSTTHYTYDGLHELLTVVDGNGHTVESNSYGVDGRVAQQQDARGQTTTFGYAADGPGGNVAPNTATDPRGIVTQYAFDGIGRLTGRSVSFQNATVTQESWAYDPAGHVLSHTDGTGAVTAMTYDGQGNVLTQTVDPGGLSLKTAFTYDGQNDVLTATDPAGHTTTMAYDGQGDLASVTDALGHRTQYGYDQYGERTSATDANSHTTTYAYGAAGDLTSVTSPGPNPATTTFAYDGAGRLVSVTDANNHATTLAVDGMGRVTSTTDALGHATSAQLDAVGNKVKVTDPNGHATTYAYNEANQLTGVTDALGKVTAYAVDPDGNRTQMTDANGHTTTYAFDGANRLASVTDALGHATAYAYDAAGRKTAVTDANGHATSYAYDRAGRLTSVTDALGKATSMGYDPAGNRTSVTDANGHQTSYTFDSANRPVSVTDPLNRTTTYTLDAAGNVTLVQQPNGTANRYLFDQNNRLVGVDVGNTGNAPGIQYAYDPIGLRTSMADSTGTTTYARDAAGRLTSVTAPQTGRVQYAYDPADELVTLTYPSGHQVSYGYTDRGQLASATDWQQRQTSYAYDDGWRLTQISAPNGVASSLTYDDANRLTGIAHAAGGTNLEAISYQLDAAGNRTQMTDSAGTTTWAYDALNRLTGAQYPNGDQVQYALDPVGNRVGITVNGQATTSTYDAADELTQSGNATYAWDANGNETGATTGGVTTTYAYDPLNRLVGIAGPTTASYAYNGDGLRVSKTVDGQTTTYTWDPTGIGRVLADGNEYLWGTGLAGRRRRRRRARARPRASPPGSPPPTRRAPATPAGSAPPSPGSAPPRRPPPAAHHAPQAPGGPPAVHGGP